MKKRIRIYPYRGYSNSARELTRLLSEDFNVLRIKNENSKYRQRDNHIVINWGNSKKPTWLNGGTMLNDPSSVNKAVNKLDTLMCLLENDIPTVHWTTELEQADKWLNDGNFVVERHIINGSKGDGIRIVDPNNGIIQECPLYTKHITKAREYRVHVFNGKVIDIQQKKRRQGEDTFQDGLVKNLANGWVFCRDNITPPPQNINEVAIGAINALGLDFGAVDILSKEGKVYVLEVNTAMGLQGETLLNYANAIKEYAEQ